MTDFKDLLQVLNQSNQPTISLDADGASIKASGGNGGDIFLGDKDQVHRIGLNAQNGSIFIREPLSGNEQLGPVSVSLHGNERKLQISVDGKPIAFLGELGGLALLALGGGGSFPGRISLRTGNSAESIQLDATTGDILLTNADCAEEFDVAETVEPGTVLVLDDEPGRLRMSEEAYDSRVAGIVSGAGAYRPGIVLDRQGEREGRQPVALVGKVFCRVDATQEPVRPGSLLTTAGTPGHAMAAVDRDRAFGAVLGKALQGLDTGCGLIPVLVGLQ